MKSNDIKSAVEKFFPEPVKTRHHLHAYPELSFQKEKTAAYISSLLNTWGIAYQTGVGRYGIAGLHAPDFDIDEKSLETGTGLLAWKKLTN